jgi:hypothetical protein
LSGTAIGINEEITITGTKGIPQGIKFFVNTKTVMESSKAIIDGVTWDLKANYTPDKILLDIKRGATEINLDGFTGVSIDDKLILNNTDGIFEKTII